jgi:fumarate reductase flavoprotein subunit
MIGVPADNLQATVASYNRAVLAAAGATLVPPRTSGRMFGESRGSSKRVALMPIAQPPFYAVALAAGITYTMGGIEIDAQARVVGRDGNPFPGLFAAGGCTGGIEGGPLGGYVGGFLKAATLGYIAAETIGSEAGIA